MNICEESIPGRRNKHRDLVGDYRNLTLTLKEIGSHWRALRKGIIGPDLYSSTTTLAAMNRL